MKKEIIRRDCNGNDVYLVISQSSHIPDLLYCYGYRKVTRKGFFKERITFVSIEDFHSELMDKRCHSSFLISLMDPKDTDESVEKHLIKSIMNRINESIQREEHYNSVHKNIFNEK